MSVPADRALGFGGVRTGWSPNDPMASVATAYRITNNIKEGLTGPRVRAAVRDLRRLLRADAVVLSGLSGQREQVGRPDDPGEVGKLVERVLHTETRQGRPPMTAVPLRSSEELLGVLLVCGDVPVSAVNRAADWIEDSLERGRLESSAEQAARSELRALRAEISPHFVYNALTVIGSLVRSEPDRCRELVLDFADFIRYGLARNREYATVSDEFHAIETYLALQRAVLGDRLRVQIRVAPDVLAVSVPYLVLQPLVENAVRHGVQPAFVGRSDGAGLVQVSGEASGNDLVISVEDDGVGMDPAEAEEILAGRGSEHSVGLANVDRRLRSIYGAWYGLVVETARGAGTKVIVRVPMFQPGVVPR
ncbi:sensor histidine kinase [Actinopolyspora erythraea]|uniref:Histidine kinase n=1 Tax=Actinopolyspora erythraea TaxID=414996 RepID=A0A099D5W5_9ACTN|nr:histidine kinase [Actinopolyspora erythraea]ASU78813.1 sensor histidine kinase [Actinopolyspora erythraea]KGI81331.1 histidine kinase [Actinopolyspora erythraea]